MSHFGTPELEALLEYGRYSIKDLDTLKGVLSDAFTLYDIEAGRGRLSDLLGVIEKRADPEAFALVIFDLAKFLGPRLRKVLSELSELQQEQASALADSFGPALERKLTAIHSVRRRLRELWVEAGVTDSAGLEIVEAQITRHIWSDSGAIARIETGDMSDVERLFRERLSAPKGLIQ